MSCSRRGLVLAASLLLAACATPDLEGDELARGSGFPERASGNPSGTTPGENAGGPAGTPAPSGTTSSKPPTPPAPSDSASVTAQSIPNAFIVGDEKDATVTMKNAGTTTWSAAAGYSLGAVSSSGGGALVDVSLPPDVTVAAGASYTFSFKLRAATVGNYTASWRMKKDAAVFGATASQALAVKPDPSLMTAEMDLKANEYKESRDGRFRFYYQNDGNVVLYLTGGAALWSSNTAGTSTGRLIMQGDGNLVAYDAGNVPVWASNTAGNNGARLVVQNDGNVVIYSPANVALWATNTAGQ